MKHQTKPTQSKLISFRADPVLFSRLKRAVVKVDRRMADIVRRLVIQGLDKNGL